MKRRFIPGMFLSIGLSVIVGCSRSGTPLERAIAADNWRAAIRLVSADFSSATNRIIGAHAFLVTNSGDKAVCEFEKTGGEEDLMLWESHAANFVRDFPGNAAARYLHGDSLARLGRYKAALAEFDRAVQLNPHHAMSFNARGVVHALLGDLQSAAADFDQAIKWNPGFADPYSNRGFLFLQKKQSPEGAFDSFNAALKISPDFGPALAGRGYALLALGSVDQGSASLEAAAGRGCTSRLLARGTPDLVAWASQRFGADAGAVDQAGTTVSRRSSLDRSFTDASELIMHGDLRRGVNMMANIIGREGPDSPYAQRAGQLYAALSKTDPPRAKEFADQTIAGRSWNASGGMADRLTAAIGAITSNIQSGRTDIGIHAGPLSVDHSGGRSNTTIDWGKVIEPQVKVTEINRSGFNALDRAIGGAGGVTTSLAAASIDSGDWPFHPVYALYPLADVGGAK